MYLYLFHNIQYHYLFNIQLIESFSEAYLLHYIAAHNFHQIHITGNDGIQN
jgi:hypothetical protein